MTTVPTVTTWPPGPDGRTAVSVHRTGTDATTVGYEPTETAAVELAAWLRCCLADAYAAGLARAAELADADAAAMTQRAEHAAAKARGMVGRTSTADAALERRMSETYHYAAAACTDLAGTIRTEPTR